MAETLDVATHIGLVAVPSVPLVSDKVDPEALVSTSTRVEADKPSESPAPGSKPQPLTTFIVNLSIQDHDDHAKQADGKRDNAPRSEFLADSSSESSKATHGDAFSERTPSDQAESEFVSSPVEARVSCPPGLQQERPPSPEAAHGAVAQTSEAPIVESDARLINCPISEDDAVVQGVGAGSVSPDVLAQTAEAPSTDNRPQSLNDPPFNEPAVPQ
ncbi:hypothetical protein FKP32DRAFT_1679318, partial [Trametes sanguinea]